MAEVDNELDRIEYERNLAKQQLKTGINNLITLYDAYLALKIEGLREIQEACTDETAATRLDRRINHLQHTLQLLHARNYRR